MGIREGSNVRIDSALNIREGWNIVSIDTFNFVKCDDWRRQVFIDLTRYDDEMMRWGDGV